MRFSQYILTIALLVGLVPAQAQPDAESDGSAWQLLQTGEAVAIMRHALAPGGGDPAGFSLDDCATQRNLSDEGRKQATDAGELLRSKGISAAQVLTSQWCRCEETARLLDVGTVTPAPMLNSFFQNRSTAEEQTQQLIEALQNWAKAPGTVRVLVTHQVNISALTSEFARSGEILIVSLQDDNVQVLLRVPT
ncbi:MAG: histidine phosphatase family protein [Granulosicoccus sp.]